jgi:hypothetical protein
LAEDFGAGEGFVDGARECETVEGEGEFADNGETDALTGWKIPLGLDLFAVKLDGQMAVAG